jgi:hypothetical protein
MSETRQPRRSEIAEAAVDAADRLSTDRLPADRLSDATLDHVSGGFLVFQFKLVAVKTVG